MKNKTLTLLTLLWALCTTPALAQSRTTNVDTTSVVNLGVHHKGDACLPPCIDTDSTDYVTRYRVINYSIEVTDGGHFTIMPTDNNWIFARTRHGRLLMFRSINREVEPRVDCYIVTDKKTARRFWRELRRFVHNRWTVADYAGIDVKMAPVGSLLEGELSHYRAIGDSTGSMRSPNRIAHFYTAGFFNASTVRAAEYYGPLFDIGATRVVLGLGNGGEGRYMYKFSTYVKTHRGKRATRVVTSGGKQELRYRHSASSDPKMTHI